MSDHRVGEEDLDFARGCLSATLISAIVAALVGLAWLLFAPNAEAANLYRYTDADGNVSYSDTIPPENTQNGYIELSKTGVQIADIPAATTHKEARDARELQLLRSEQALQLEAQQAKDAALMESFATEDELYLSRDSKIEGIVLLLEGSLHTLERQQAALADLKVLAADHERVGTPIPQRTKDLITQTEKAIAGSIAYTEEQQRRRKAVVDQHEAMRQRMRQLKGDDSETQ